MIKLVKGDLFSASVKTPAYQTDIVGDWDLNESNSLYLKAFRHHVVNRPFKSHFKLPDSELTDEKVAHMFHANFYDAELYEGYQGNRTIDIDGFFDSFSESPINVDSEADERLGSNKIAVIIGKVGTGKTTFLSQLLVKYYNAFKRKKIFVVRVDVEKFAGRDVAKGIFFRSLFNHLQSEIFELSKNDYEFWQNKFHMLAPDEDSVLDHVMATQYMAAIKGLFLLLREKYGQRGMIFLDNLDKYYYLFDRWSFSDEGAKLRLEGMIKLKDILIEFENHGQLDGTGLCVLIALRRHTLDYLISNNYAAPFQAIHLDTPDGNSIFRVKPKSELEIINSRIELIKKIGEIALNKPDKT